MTKSRTKGTLYLAAVLSLVLSAPVGSATVPYVFFPQEAMFENWIQREALENNVDPALFKALIAQESEYYYRAVSSAGAIGLTQIMPGTARESCPDIFRNESMFEPESNIKCGARILGELLTAFDYCESCALSGFNQGKYLTIMNRGLPATDETRKYIPRVLAYKKAYLTH